MHRNLSWLFSFTFFYFLNPPYLKVAGVSPKDLTDILPTSLIHGYGEKVCTFLLLLCSLALIHSNHTWAPLSYKNFTKNKNEEIETNIRKKGDVSSNNKTPASSRWKEDVRENLNYLIMYLITYFDTFKLFIAVMWFIFCLHLFNVQFIFIFYT